MIYNRMLINYEKDLKKRERIVGGRFHMRGGGDIENKIHFT